MISKLKMLNKGLGEVSVITPDMFYSINPLYHISDAAKNAKEGESVI